ncbi:O-antigen ligase family protein [Candidatus Sumerlaeota bacterium]|nr:O-antigen ligase family protein [Candidatus Sumerlaeota bacterium]
MAVCAWALTVSALCLSLWLVAQDFGALFYENESWKAALARLPAAIRDPLRWLLDHLTGRPWLIPRLSDWRAYLSAGLGNTNHIADYLALLYPMVFMQYLVSEGKVREIVSLSTLLAGSAAMVACWSVSSNGGLILAAIVMAVLLIRHESGELWRRRALRLSVLAILLVAIVLFYVLPHAANPHPGGIFRQAFASERWKAGWPTRLAIWLPSLEMIRQHPWLGIGAGNFTYGFTKTLSPRVLSDPDLAPYAGIYTNAAHNELLQAWVETGVVGSLLLVALWVCSVGFVARGMGADRSDGRRVRITLLAMWAAFIVHSQMNFTLQLPTSSLLFVALVAVSAAIRTEPGGFPLTVRSTYGPIDLDLETTNMRRVESVGLRLAPSPIVRGAVAVMAVGLAICSITITLRPLVADVFFNRAKAAHQLAQAEAAEHSARRALALNPDHHTARKLLGRVLLETGRYAEARQQLERVCERESVHDFYDELGWACWHLGDREAAGRAWATYFGRCPQARSFDPDLFAFFSREFPKEAAEQKTITTKTRRRQESFVPL